MHGESKGDNGPSEEVALEGLEGEGEPSAREASDPLGPVSASDESDPLARAQSESARFKDAWMRTAADFDNFRKRTRREVDEARRSGREDLLRVLLPVFDNLERALQSAQRSSDVRAMADGLKMVERQFGEALGREGITRIPTVGQPFDPSLHEAIQQVETREHPAGTVLAEVQPGYKQGDKLVRAAMVVVAKPKTDIGNAAS